jgi:hypothetical protein
MPSRGSARKLALERPGRPRRDPPTGTAIVSAAARWLRSSGHHRQRAARVGLPPQSRSEYRSRKIGVFSAGVDDPGSDSTIAASALGLTHDAHGVCGVPAAHYRPAGPSKRARQTRPRSGHCGPGTNRLRWLASGCKQTPRRSRRRPCGGRAGASSLPSQAGRSRPPSFSARVTRSTSRPLSVPRTTRRWVPSWRRRIACSMATNGRCAIRP